MKKFLTIFAVFGITVLGTTLLVGCNKLGFSTRIADISTIEINISKSVLLLLNNIKVIS